jgi:serine/threonine-protein kinase HipA
MDSIISDVRKIVSNWKAIAKDIGISKSEQEVMASAFRY